MDGQDAHAQPLSRRERGKREKQQRIRAAAAELFTAEGYANVTTHAIAEAADVGTGTLFRYFPTKADLLVAVMDHLLTLGIEQALAAAADGADAIEAILLAVDPLVQAAIAQPENTTVYQREVMFGAGRSESGIAPAVRGTQAAIERIVAARALNRGIDATRVAEAIYASMFIELARTTSGWYDASTLPSRLRSTVTFLVDALLGPAA